MEEFILNRKEHLDSIIKRNENIFSQLRKIHNFNDTTDVKIIMYIAGILYKQDYEVNLHKKYPCGIAYKVNDEWVPVTKNDYMLLTRNPDSEEINGNDFIFIPENHPEIPQLKEYFKYSDLFDDDQLIVWGSKYPINFINTSRYYLPHSKYYFSRFVYNENSIIYERHRKKGDWFDSESVEKIFEMDIPLVKGNVVIFHRTETTAIHSVIIYKDRTLKEKNIIPLNDILVPHFVNHFDCNDEYLVSNDVIYKILHKFDIYTAGMVSGEIKYEFIIHIGSNLEQLLSYVVDLKEYKENAESIEFIVNKPAKANEDLNIKIYKNQDNFLYIGKCDEIGIFHTKKVAKKKIGV